MHVFTIVPCFLITSYKQQHLSLFKMMVYSTRYQGKDNFTQKKTPVTEVEDEEKCWQS